MESKRVNEAKAFTAIKEISSSQKSAIDPSSSSSQIALEEIAVVEMRSMKDLAKPMVPVAKAYEAAEVQVSDSLLQIDDKTEQLASPANVELSAVLRYLARTRAVVPDDEEGQQ